MEHKNDPRIYQNRPPASVGAAKSIQMIKNTFPTPPSLIFHSFLIYFGPVLKRFSAKNKIRTDKYIKERPYVQITYEEGNEPMFKEWKEYVCFPKDPSKYT